MLKKFNFVPLFKLDEKKPIYKHSSFWLAFAFPLFVAILLSLPIQSELDFCFTSECYSCFVDEFSFPLKLASLSLVLAFAVGRAHHSKQRAITLSNNETNINFTLFLQHEKTVSELLDKWVLKVPNLVGDEFSSFVKDSTKTNNTPTQNFAKIELNGNNVYKLLFFKNTLKKFESELLIEDLKAIKEKIDRHTVMLEEHSTTLNLNNFNDCSGVGINITSMSGITNANNKVFSNIFRLAAYCILLKALIEFNSSVNSEEEAFNKLFK